MKTKTDLQEQSWLAQHIPDAYKPYVFLGRFDRPIGIWLLALPGWWAIALGATGLTLHALWLFMLFGIGAAVMRAAGCVINDIWDRDLDKKVARTSVRPLAAGTLSLKHAFIFLLCLLAAGLGILIQLNPIAIMLGLISIPLIISYPLMKRITFFPQLFLGFTFNFGILIGWAAMNESLSLSAFLLYFGAIFWTLGYDTIYAHQDKEDDLMAGIKSTAIKFGAQSKLYVAAFYIIAFKCITFAFMFEAGWFGLAVLPAGAHLAWQLKTWDEENPDTALKIFKSNRDTGILILLAALITQIF